MAVATQSKKVQKQATFFGLSEEHSADETSQAVIIQAPYENTSSYGRGSKNGPKAIMDASQQVEHFDEELWCEPFRVGIATAAEVKCAAVSAETENPFSELTDAVRHQLNRGKFPIVLGGEHSVSIGPVRACVEKFPDLSILQVNAHAAMRQSRDGNPYCQSTVSYNLYKLMPKPAMATVGVRNISAEEVEWLEKEEPNINLYWARQYKTWNFSDIVNTLSDNVYLSIDVDGLDSSIMPATGAPEPGGMTWYQLMDLVKTLCVRKNVVGADIVELSPIPKMHAPDFLVAKLLYKLIGYRFALELGVTKKYL